MWIFFILEINGFFGGTFPSSVGFYQALDQAGPTNVLL
jgi:hypothetical protein